MAAHKKSWILVKGCEYNPGRSLSLGQILSDPFQPSLPLQPDGPLPIPESSIESSFQDNVVHISGSQLNASFRVWANANLGPGIVEQGVNWESSKELSWHFDKLEGYIFIPQISYVSSSLQSDSITSQIRSSRFSFRKRLYMVTGVRIARGARMSDQMSRASGMNTTLGADGMAVGIPISTGLDGGLSHMSNTTNSFQAASDFVYAYRLCEVYYSKKVRLKPYSQGETYAVGQVEKDGTGTDQSEEASEDEEIPGISVDGICNVDYSGDGILEKATESGFEDEEYYLLN